MLGRTPPVAKKDRTNLIGILFFLVFASILFAIFTWGKSYNKTYMKYIFGDTSSSTPKEPKPTGQSTKIVDTIRIDIP